MKLIFSFLIILLSASSSCQDILTIGEVFDFDVGDIFHYKSQLNGEPDNATRLTIIEKSYSQGLDTVSYLIRRSYYDKYQDDGEIRYEVSTYSSTYTNLDSSILSYKPELTYDSLINGCVESNCEIDYDTIIQENYCDIPCNGIKVMVDWMSYHHILYGKGLGLIKSYFSMEENPSGPYTDYVLFYFKKANCEYGTPDLTYEEQDKYQSLILFPNPTSEKLIIKVSPNTSIPNSIRLYDINGRLILSRIPTTELETFNLSGVNKGLFILKVDFREGSVVEKIVIE